MFNLLKELEKNKIFFPVEYFGLNDFGTFWDIKTVLENKEVFQNYLASKSLQNIESINDYLDYLYLKKTGGISRNDLHDQKRRGPANCKRYFLCCETAVRKYKKR